MPDKALESKAKILIVDDEVIIAADLEIRLQELGYAVCGKARSGEKALQLAEQHRPVLVMLDIVLAGDTDGIDVAEIIRDKWRIPVVFLTAYAETDRLERAKLAYPFGYLLKPYGDRDLRITVEMALYVAEVDAERSRAEEALRKTGEKYRGIFDESVAAIYVFDCEKNFMDSNQAGLDLLGYSREELLAMSIPDVDADPVVVLPAHRQLLSGDRIINYEHRLKRKDGKIITVLNNSRPLTDAQGNVTGMQSTLIDISDRKHMEEALRESEAKYRRLSENSPAVVYQFMMTPDGEFSFPFVSEAMQSTTGVSAEATMRNPREFLGRIHPDDKEAFRQSVMKAAESLEPWTGCFRFLKNGDEVWLEGHSTAERRPDGSILWDGFFLDVTKRKRAEEALRESEEFFRLAFSTSPHAIVVTRLVDGMYVDINEGFTHLTGYSAEEIIGKTSLQFDIWHDPTERQQLVNGLREKGRVDNLVSKFRNKDGSLKKAQMSARVINLKGEPHIISITRDIINREPTEKG